MALVLNLKEAHHFGSCLFQHTKTGAVFERKLRVFPEPCENSVCLGMWEREIRIAHSKQQIINGYLLTFDQNNTSIRHSFIKHIDFPLIWNSLYATTGVFLK
jgi:hypothetical protein